MKNNRRIIALLLCVSVLFSCAAVMCSAGEEDVNGDVDGDGVLTVADARSILRMAAGLEEVYGPADYDGDGTVTSADAQIVFNLAMNLPVLVKNGDNIVEDGRLYPNNRFIKIIVGKYRTVSSNALVAIYTEPESDSNFVLQFSKKSLMSNEYGRSPSDLEKVYQIDLNGKISVATKTGIGCEGCSSGESILIFYLVKNVMMPQSPEVFDVD